MAQIPWRRAFGQKRSNDSEGFHDDYGMSFHAGSGVFVNAAYTWGNESGLAAAQLWRSYQNKGDTKGEYRQVVELLWTMNTVQLKRLSAWDVIPQRTRDYMEAHPTPVVATITGRRKKFSSALCPTCRSSSCASTAMCRQRRSGPTGPVKGCGQTRGASRRSLLGAPPGAFNAQCLL